MAGCGEVLLFLSSEAVASFSFAVSRVFQIEKMTAHGLLWWCSMGVQRSMTSYPIPCLLPPEPALFLVTQLPYCGLHITTLHPPSEALPTAV